MFVGCLGHGFKPASNSNPSMPLNRESPDPRYGSWKFIHEISLEDMKSHPIWVWCTALGLEDEDDGPIGGDETSMRPLLNSIEVPLDHTLSPLVLLRIEGTSHYASGLYDHEKQRLDSITIFAKNGVLAPKRVAGLPTVVTYTVIPSINGKRTVRFSAAKESDTAIEVAASP
jgi:hypothetical protein